MDHSDYKRTRIRRPHFTSHTNTKIMTRSSIEACAIAFIVVLSILFVYCVFRVGGQIGFWG